MRGGRLGPGAALVALTLGGTLIACGAGMLVCAAVGVADGEAALALGLPGLASVALGAAIVLGPASAPPRGLSVRPVAGMLAVTLAWLSASAIGAVPLLAAGTFPSPLDAFFEGASGFTTTGATLIRDVGAEPSAVLLWRSIMQWLGGVGIVVLVVAIAPVTGPGVQRAFYAETSGVTAERLTPRIIDTAKIIATIYAGLSLAAVLAYAIAGMSLFDAVNHSMTTISTGGFSTRTDSIGAFHSLPIELVAIVFMILSGVNFAFYWRALRGRPVMPQAAEVLAFLAVLLAAIAAVALSLWLADDVSGGASSIRDAAFSVTSVITTTGFVTVDFDTWNSFARTAILVLMSIGACAGSTVGGIKVIRIVLLGRAARQELDRQLHPTAVKVLRFGGHVYSEDVRRAILGFFLVYALVYVVGSLAMAASGLDPLSAIAATAASLNVVGPGIGEVGATDNYQAASTFGRAFLPILMIAGRVEVFTVVALIAALLRPRARG